MPLAYWPGMMGAAARMGGTRVSIALPRGSGWQRRIDAARDGVERRRNRFACQQACAQPSGDGLRVWRNKEKAVRAM